MTKYGSIVRWDATRAFGFIRSADSAGDVFFHVRDYRGSTPPREGLAVVFEEIHVGGKGPRAMAVRTAASPQGAEDARSSDSKRTQRPAPAKRSAPTPAQTNARAKRTHPPPAHPWPMA
jgi:cold shock CspA family protein